MKKFITKRTGKWMVAGGGAVFVAAAVGMFAMLLPAYELFGACNAGSCATSFDTRGVVARVTAWAVIASAAVVLAGVVIMLSAKTSKKTTNKK